MKRNGDRSVSSAVLYARNDYGGIMASVDCVVGRSLRRVPVRITLTTLCKYHAAPCMVIQMSAIGSEM